MTMHFQTCLRGGAVLIALAVSSCTLDGAASTEPVSDSEAPPLEVSAPAPDHRTEEEITQDACDRIWQERMQIKAAIASGNVELSYLPLMAITLDSLADTARAVGCE